MKTSRVDGVKAPQDAESRPQERLRRHFFSSFVLQVPDAISMGQGFQVHAALGLDADLEAAHVEQEVRVVLGIHRPAFARA